MVLVILVRFLSWLAMLRTIISGRYELRALLVFAALLSFCVSNNVGLSFFPLQWNSNQVSKAQPGSTNAKASPSRSPLECDTFRVPIMSQKRGDKEPESHPRAAILSSDLLFPENSGFPAEHTSRCFVFLPVSVSQPEGRAPPRLA